MDDLPVKIRAMAARDRNLLGKLVAMKKVRLLRDNVKPEHADFVADIMRRARAQEPKSTVNLAIRPKKRKKR